MSAFEELKDKLREIFQLDRTDLDFGLYRIMNLKSDEVASFIDNDLLPQVKDGIKSFISGDNVAIKNDLLKAEEQARQLGVDPDTSPKVQELKEKLSNAFDAEKIENEIYSDLFNFFKRYYSDGDFLSLRRYKEGVYALPYEGEEVKLYWANADQYYIKSGETFTNYTFKTRTGKKIRFEVIKANTEQNNNKDSKNRRFRLVDEITGEVPVDENDEDAGTKIIPPVRFEDGEFIISFSYLPTKDGTKQEALNKEIYNGLLVNPELISIVNELSALTGTEKNKIPVLLKHLNNFTAKNTFDYFIHKDLGKFLNRELDFYIKNEIMHIDDIEDENAAKVEQYLGKVKVLRRVAKKIIAFLASLEDFQKKIWLKKKFVLETNYCITLDRVPEDLYPEIIKNDAQRKEWVKLFAINEIDGIATDLLNANVAYSEPLTESFLKANPYLVLDTAFFDAEFKYKLLGSIDNFDEQCDGLLVNSDNYHYLSLTQEKQKEDIKYIYIDPPYNTGNDGFLYKDSYQHSSWLTMIENRIAMAYNMLSEDGILCISIDDNEVNNIHNLLNNIFLPDNFIALLPRVTKKAGKEHSDNISKNHDFLLLFAKNKSNLKLRGQDIDNNDYKFEDEFVLERGRYKLNQTLDYDSLWYNTTMDFPIEVNGETFYPGGSFSEHQKRHNGIHNPKDWVWRWSKAAFDFGYKNGFVVIKEGKERKRIYTKTYAKAKIIKTKDVYSIAYFDREMHQSSIEFIDNKYSNDNAKKEIAHYFPANIFDFPKPTSLVKKIGELLDDNSIQVMDFFAGSGTTGHAVINLNREDGGNRKYILVEMGSYFDKITKPRIEKVIYSEDWKNGKPVSRKGSSHCFKYIRLESYEDALDNLKFERTKRQDDLLQQPQNASVKEEYMLRYMLDLETKGSLLNIQKFATPFDYEMTITRDGETKTVKADLVETFNYLIGLNVKFIQNIRGILSVEGVTRDGEKTLVLWRNTNEMNSEKLDEWFKNQHYSTQDMEFDTIYVNGDNNLENLRKSDETWKVRLIEAEFQKRMFDVRDV